MTKCKCINGSVEDVNQDELEVASKIFKKLKLERLAELEGVSVNDMISTFDSVVPAICMNPNCDYCTGMEPDQDEGWCEMCNTLSMCSCLVLAEVI